MSCPPPVSGSQQLVLVVPAELEGQYLWPRSHQPRILAADTGPQGCCDCCGVLVQTDVAARVGLGPTIYDPTAPSLGDPQTLRHVPWIKAITSPQGPCVSNARVYYSDLSRAVGYAAPQACVQIVALDPEAAGRDERLGWITAPRAGQSYGADGESVWSIWLRWQIACCACLEQASPRITYGQVIGPVAAAAFDAPPYATHATVYVSPSAAGYTISMRDPTGTIVLWSDTSTAPVYALRWPEAMRLHVNAPQNTRVVVVWETV